MRFVTRKMPRSTALPGPWLIRRFIDRDAEFLYVEPQDVLRVAREKDAVPYDVEGVELGHVDGRCSFESIVLKYALDDPAIERMAAIVHGADVEADLARTPSRPGSRRWRWAFASSMAIPTTRSSRRRCRCMTPSTPGARHRLGGPDRLVGLSGPKRPPHLEPARPTVQRIRRSAAPSRRTWKARAPRGWRRSAAALARGR